MTPINFVYWLQGFLEIGDPKSLDSVQIQEIRNHISLVLDKQTPYTSIKDGKLCDSKDFQINGFMTDMNSNPFPLNFLTFKHHASC